MTPTGPRPLGDDPEQPLTRAERKAMRRVKWRAFWRGFVQPFGPLRFDYERERQRFYRDVRRFERDAD